MNNKEVEIKMRELGFYKTKRDGNEIRFIAYSVNYNQLVAIYNVEQEAISHLFVKPRAVYKRSDAENVIKDLSALKATFKESSIPVELMKNVGSQR